MKVFLSHNKADKDVARLVGASLVLAGGDVWFDEWEIQAGDSIPGKLNEGLDGFDIFVLLWSANAARSNWVRKELEVAIHETIEGGRGRVIPCCLDETELPPLIADLKREDFHDPKEATPHLVDSILGFRSRRERVLAIQGVLERMDINWFFGRTFGPMICCPACGAEDSLGGSVTTDRRGDLYEVVRCKACGWNDASEL